MMGLKGGDGEVYKVDLGQSHNMLDIPISVGISLGRQPIFRPNLSKSGSTPHTPLLPAMPPQQA